MSLSKTLETISPVSFPSSSMPFLFGHPLYRSLSTLLACSTLLATAQRFGLPACFVFGTSRSPFAFLMRLFLSLLYPLFPSATLVWCLVCLHGVPRGHCACSLSRTNSSQCVGVHTYSYLLLPSCFCFLDLSPLLISRCSFRSCYCNYRQLHQSFSTFNVLCLRLALSHAVSSPQKALHDCFVPAGFFHRRVAHRYVISTLCLCTI